MCGALEEAARCNPQHASAARFPCLALPPVPFHPPRRLAQSQAVPRWRRARNGVSTQRPQRVSPSRLRAPDDHAILNITQCLGDPSKDAPHLDVKGPLAAETLRQQLLIFLRDRLCMRPARGGPRDLGLEIAFEGSSTKDSVQSVQPRTHLAPIGFANRPIDKSLRLHLFSAGTAHMENCRPASLAAGHPSAG